MEKVIQNEWLEVAGQAYAKAEIIKKHIHPEGLDVNRLRFFKDGTYEPDPAEARITSLARGKGLLTIRAEEPATYQTGPGLHLYLPPGNKAVWDLEAGSELVEVATGERSQIRGNKLILRDERFMVACGAHGQSYRWILTPQYLSRRVFLHHDHVLMSRSQNPVSWFRTTMFDVSGLPANEEGMPVFKMSYNSRTEFNVCYEVSGIARVRMALHPYRDQGQSWSPWIELDAESTYHLNETAGGAEEEGCFDEKANKNVSFRNKHEVYIEQGQVTLFCLFDPAPVGIEKHIPGAYSDYEPLAQVVHTDNFRNFHCSIAQYDEMVDTLSRARALGRLESIMDSPLWAVYREGLGNQNDLEKELMASPIGRQRHQTLRPWFQPPGNGSSP